ncbi:hypothetical protein [Bifidobacterium jacchi]|uniref:Uncharacterized protein n=1 Tax=Bifidobacterium jacchi TaxID=2490545 RepID=A0A5N5RD51_9BIFI|nr:hypothetical protein [Bifidobacterium jacchi]KAB5604814.1 hypothetical protein EHS19_09675 [Bifidobacterium jacchi]
MFGLRGRGRDDAGVETRPVPLPGGGTLGGGSSIGAASAAGASAHGQARRRVLPVVLALLLLAAVGVAAAVGVWSGRSSAPAEGEPAAAVNGSSANVAGVDSRSDDETARKEHDLDVRAATPDRNDKSSPVIVTVTPKGDGTNNGKADDKTGTKADVTTGTVTVLRDAPDHRSATGSVRAAAGDTITVASINDDGTVSRATHVVAKDDVAKAEGKTDGKDTSTTGTSKNASKNNASKDAAKDATASTDTSKGTSQDDAKDDSKDGMLDLDTPKDPDVTADQLKAFLDALDKAHRAGKMTDGATKAAAEAAARNPHADDAVKRAASGIVDAIGKAGTRTDDKKTDNADAKTNGNNDGNGDAGASDKPANGTNGGQTATPAPTPSKPTGNGSANNGSNGNGNDAPKPRVWVETKPAWTETVHHDAVTHVERVKVKDAWDETKLVVRIRIYDGMGGEWYFDSLSEAEAFAKAETLKGHGVAMQDMSQYKTIHHEAEYQDRTVIDKPAWDENVKVRDAWTEQVRHPAEYKTVTHKAEYKTVQHPAVTHVEHDVLLKPEHTVHHEATYEDRKVVDKAAWTEPIPATYKTVHHEAEYKTVHHPAVTHTEKVKVKDAWDERVDHPAEYKDVRHPAVTHTEKVKVKDAWNETVPARYEDKTVTDREAWTEKVKVRDAWTETVHHAARYVDRTVVVKAPWTERVVVREAWTETVRRETGRRWVEPVGHWEWR